ncbi:MAG: glycosyltransferase family 2 protein [Chloroherpetonaceae bacterium]|nr:glycosyltransferase family 2 protein [Chloroherpetonaceae bacterium]
MPEISVLLAVHNAERFIEHSLNSVFAQTFRDIEIVVIDDGSQDKTLTKLLSIKNQSPFPFIIETNPENRERIYSRNRAAEIASGEYLFFLDHDDAWRSNHLELMLNLIKKSDADAICSPLRSKMNMEGVQTYTSKKALSNNVGELIFAALVGGTPGIGFKKSAFPKYEDSFLFREDWELMIRSYLKGLKIVCGDFDTVIVREHPNRSSDCIPYFINSLKVFETYRNQVPKKYQHLFQFEIGSTAMRFGDLPKGWAMMIPSLIQDPTLNRNPRMWLLLLKRGFRIDKYLRHYSKGKKN